MKEQWQMDIKDSVNLRKQYANSSPNLPMIYPASVFHYTVL